MALTSYCQPSRIQKAIYTSEYVIQIFTHLLYKTPILNRPLSQFELEPKHNSYIG